MKGAGELEGTGTGTFVCPAAAGAAATQTCYTHAGVAESCSPILPECACGDGSTPLPLALTACCSVAPHTHTHSSVQTCAGLWGWWGLCGLPPPAVAPSFSPPAWGWLCPVVLFGDGLPVEGKGEGHGQYCKHVVLCMCVCDCV